MRTMLGSIIAGCWLALPAGAEPTFDVATDRAAYGFGEPVWFYVTVANQGASELAIENPQCSRTQTRIEIRDDAGNVFPMTGPATCATTILETIAPGDDMLYAFELLEFFGVDGSGELPYGILPAGDYEVLYRTATHASSSVGFTVTDLPAGETEAFHAYVRAVASVRSTDMRGATHRFRDFVRTYPHSPYAAVLLCRAGVISDLFFDSELAREDFTTLVHLYPESGYVSTAIRHLAFGMGRDRSEGLDVITALPDEVPGTLAARLAERVLARLTADEQS